jgi:hypothetical protein
MGVGSLPPVIDAVAAAGRRDGLISDATNPRHTGGQHTSITTRANRWRNLKSLCQHCHMIHDRPYHLAQRRITYLLRRALGDLFLGPTQRHLTKLVFLDHELITVTRVRHELEPRAGQPVAQAADLLG